MSGSRPLARRTRNSRTYIEDVRARGARTRRVRRRPGSSTSCARRGASTPPTGRGRKRARRRSRRMPRCRASSLFMEAQLKSPKVPLVRMKPPAWAVLARLAWHAGHHGGIEDYRDARDRAEKAATCSRTSRAKTASPCWSRTATSTPSSGARLRKQGWRRREARTARSFGTRSSTSAR